MLSSLSLTTESRRAYRWSWSAIPEVSNFKRSFCRRFVLVYLWIRKTSKYQLRDLVRSNMQRRWRVNKVQRWVHENEDGITNKITTYMIIINTKRNQRNLRWNYGGYASIFHKVHDWYTLCTIKCTVSTGRLRILNIHMKSLTLMYTYYR